MRKAKQRTKKQVEAAQAKAVQAAEVLQDDDDLADEIESLSTEEYTERRGWEIVNPNPKEQLLMTRVQMQIRIKALEAENGELIAQTEELAEKLDSISAIIETDDDGDDGDDGDDDDDEDSDEEN